MPFEQHPTDPDKLIMRAGNYNLQKPWVGLTEEEVRKICVNEWGINEWGRYEQVRAIEAKLKDKNT